MKTLTDATLLVVSGPRGAYFAILDNESGTVLTERTEHAAAALANEKDMVIVDRREIGHAELLRMMAARYDRMDDKPAADQPADGSEPAKPAPTMGLAGAARNWLGQEVERTREA
ncbi:MAG TPA: hypothetical protein VGI81_11175 [Tepidisphaeraceae bacterium]